MSRWRRSVDELTAGRRRQQAECERAQNALSRVTSCFQQLAASLGSSADSSFLREEMDETRALAHRICSGNTCPSAGLTCPSAGLTCPSAGLSRRLLRLLSACDSAPIAVDDRHASERLWVLFLSAVENFLSDLRRAKDLIGQFPLTQRSSRRSLVNTGCTDGPVGLAARVALVQIPWLVLEEEPSPDLTNHIARLEAQLGELQQRVPVAFWSVESTQPAWAEVLSDAEDPEESLEDLMEVASSGGGSTRLPACCQGTCCWVG
uniref:Regulator of G protein signaling 9 binding protein n=1 Tax=Poecilia mexicana TaxID=48701 RepID=A0A3B3XRV0_9TELE